MPFSNGRREGANPSSRVIVLPDQEFPNHFADQLCCLKLGISIPSLRTCILGDWSHQYRKYRWRLHLILWSSKSSRKPLWQLGDSTRYYRGLGQYIEMCLSSMLFRMLNLSIFILWFIYGILFCYIWIFVVPFFVLVVNKSRSSLHTLTCICIA